MWKRLATLTLKQGRRLVIAVIGGTVVLIGIAMLVLPGPGMMVIPLGLAILATEFIWARRLLRELKRRAGVAVHGARRWFGWKGGRITPIPTEETRDGARDEHPDVVDGGDESSPAPSSSSSPDTRHAA